VSQKLQAVQVLLAFAAGLVARTYTGERLTRWFEGSLVCRNTRW
jgi:hypothetical protein